ncbi:flagellar protein FlaG [Paenibacillus sp. SYP-B4298]|uniref:flagellar protein FlaG n=1 Tax=Paenibacillus sp. SYP-B4298 TaxID=2996034 RepID=UPI0022DCE7C7|nr:flagellar protein FlaG [Paenibacillus sp. SYP-B4298]
MSIQSSFPGSALPGGSSLNPVDSSPAEPKTVNFSSTVSNVNELKQAELRGEKVTISDEQAVRALERAIKALQGRTTSLEFSVHETTKMIAVKVKDVDTGEVIREIPPEKTLDLVAKLWEVSGIFVDEKR